MTKRMSRSIFPVVITGLLAAGSATAAIAEDANERRQAALAELAAEFDRRLAALKSPETRSRVEAVMAARGRTKRRPKAGVSF